MKIEVAYIGEDRWGMQLFQNLENKSIYANVDGNLNTTTKDGEPSCNLKKDLIVNVIIPFKDLITGNLPIKETRGQHRDIDDIARILKQRGWKEQPVQTMYRNGDKIISLKDENGQFITIRGGDCEEEEEE